jgi:hypothetical protein
VLHDLQVELFAARGAFALGQDRQIAENRLANTALAETPRSAIGGTRSGRRSRASVASTART